MRWVFEICKELGIDDPVYWMDNVSPKLVDMWISFFIASEELKHTKRKQTPDQLDAQMRKVGG